MLFNSAIFLVFGLAFFLLWQWAKNYTNARLVLVTLSSFLFYGWWDWRFLFLIIGSGLLDYFVGLSMDKYPNRRKLFLLVSIIGNIGSLAAFKYSGFIFENLDLILHSYGYGTNLKGSIPDFMLITPVGISFYTFQSMSYTIDIYRKELKPTKNIMQFFAYLSMFPQLVAGPIVRAKDLLPQLLQKPKTSEQDRYDGMKLIVHGYFKKMVLADNLAPIVNQAFVHENMSSSSLYWWLVITAFAFQIYFDFSGYSDIARGLARWMGLSFNLNFNHPYTSLSLREFWTRWHISLSTWFKDYVYIPLGGSKGKKWSGDINMWVTMLVSGLWHGANWTFVVWGAIHAFFLNIERRFKWPNILMKNSISRILLLLLVMVQVWVAWVFFRADDIHQALFIVDKMFSFNTDFYTPLNFGDFILIAVGIMREIWIYHKIDRNKFYPEKWKFLVDVALMVLFIVLIVFLRGSGNEFIYFQF